MLKQVLKEALKKPTSKAVKVFVLPYDSTSKRAKKPEADGRVRFNQSCLERNRAIFQKWIDLSNFKKGVYSIHEFVSDTDAWTDTIDDANLLMGALELLGYGKVIGNTEQEELLKSKGFEGFPLFKFEG